MAKRVRAGTNKEWREIGEQARAARIALHACVRGTVTEIVPSAIAQRLRSAVGRFDDVIREVEWHMLRSNRPRDETIFGLLAEDAECEKGDDETG